MFILFTLGTGGDGEEKHREFSFLFVPSPYWIECGTSPEKGASISEKLELWICKN